MLIEGGERRDALFMHSSVIDKAGKENIVIRAHLVFCSLGLKDGEEDFSIRFSAFGGVRRQNLAHARWDRLG